VEAELLFEVYAVGFDRFRAQMEDLRDLARAAPLANQSERL
jgi:hypothetical protein